MNRKKRNEIKIRRREERASSLNNVSCWAQSQHAQTCEWIVCLHICIYVHCAVYTSTALSVYLLYVCMSFTFQIVAATAIILRTSYAECVQRVQCAHPRNVRTFCIYECVCAFVYININTYNQSCHSNIFTTTESRQLRATDLFVLLFSTFFISLHLFGSTTLEFVHLVNWEPVVLSLSLSLSIYVYAFAAPSRENFFSSASPFLLPSTNNEKNSIKHIGIVKRMKELNQIFSR